MMTNPVQEASPPRDLAIDRLRGILVILMVAGNYIAGINWVPSFLKHAPDIGFTIADTVAPLFVFVIALNYGASFRRRAHVSKKSAYQHFALRYLSLIGIGAIFTAGAALADRPTGWGVLESLGVAGLLALAVIRLQPIIRIGLGLVLLGVYQYVLNTAMLNAVLHSGHGGLFGAVSWSGLLIISTGIADLWRKGRMTQLITLAAAIASAIVSTLVIPVSKNRVSMSYLLCSLALCMITFMIVKLISDHLSRNAGLLTWWGKHALVLYVVHLLVLALFGLPPIPWWYVDAPAWLAVTQLAAILTFMTLVARRLETKSAR